LENTLIPIRLANADLKEGEDQARSLLERLGLGARLTHRPHQLSGGEQQRVALARALIRRPQLLLCDEPTGNLDSKTASAMMDLLWEQVQERGLALVLVTHNEELARKVDISYHLIDGKLGQVATK
jgi:predicted ABC-type transport system involved in lysophospholipase L1 biosynthesis ATPase subunit